MDLRIEKDELTPVLRELRKRLTDTTPVMHILGQLIAQQVKLGFSTSTDPYGEPWAPLKLRDGVPLRDTGRLMNSITYNVVAQDSVDVGTNTCYAIVHQTGARVTAHGVAGRESLCGYITKGAPVLSWKVGEQRFFAKSVTIPARKILPDGELPQTWRKHIVDTLNAYLGGAAEAAT